MSEAKHTPGPWTLETVPIGSRGGSNTAHKIGPFCCCIYDDWRPREAGISEAENLANARLIAAAPDLLEAGRGMMALIDNLMRAVPWGMTHDLDIKALNEAPTAMANAIAKAEGR